MKRILGILLLAALLLSGCANAETQRYSVTYLDLFDTVTTITGSAATREEFDETAAKVHDLLLQYHQLFDIYNEYPGITNLKTVNDCAAAQPVAVDERIMQMLCSCIAYYDLTGGRVNVAMGSVLSLWHEARTYSLENPQQAYIPSAQALSDAAAHTNISDLCLDEQAGTVFFSDPQLKLDVGAVAKGWAVEQAALTLPEGWLLNVGGNVRATGPKDTDETPWSVGIQNPDGSDGYLHILAVSGGSVVTSGDYQRTYVVAEQQYHHIIDPQTGYPAQYWSSVTVICPDSGLADALSTALFVLPLEQGQALLTQCGAQAMWVDGTGQKYYSPGFESNIQS